jgi:predicted ABC-type ATPase
MGIKKKVVIMRGLQGSGKTTMAELLVGENGVIHSTDDYFVVNGKYFFDRTKLIENHAKNFAAFCESLKIGIPMVICDNTNARVEHFQHYMQAAEKAGYMVSIMTMLHPTPEIAAERTVHNVPLHTIQNVLRLWEPYP